MLAHVMSKAVQHAIGRNELAKVKLELARSRTKSAASTKEVKQPKKRARHT